MLGFEWSAGIIKARAKLATNVGVTALVSGGFLGLEFSNISLQNESTESVRLVHDGLYVVPISHPGYELLPSVFQ